ncbi:MAG: NADH-quinone oxidoreductase subunit J [Ignavibacteriales bacterium CG07_land_8_20_14_0_80_59_12]|nr:MAG: NADH-quinone oxidoreductase subunit J [Ignavibacteriales bacterium CG07_land_8_20_14_0_80_59_12]
MDFVDIIFVVFALIVVVSAFIVVFSRSIIRSAFSLLFTFFGVAGLYVLLNADFLAVTQVLIYVGGILILILFGVMLTTNVVSVEIKTGTLQTVPAAVIVAVLSGTIAGIFWFTEWHTAPAREGPTTKALGTLFMTDYLLPFEIASILLLVALIGAAMIARHERGTEGGR